MSADIQREFSRMRRQAVAMNMLYKLRAGLLHEFKGPLQAILSAVYLLEKKHEAASSAASGAPEKNPSLWSAVNPARMAFPPAQKRESGPKGEVSTV